MSDLKDRETESWERLKRLADASVSRETFVKFVQALADDESDERRSDQLSPPPSWGPGWNGWEHGTIGDFLDAAVAAGHSLPEEPSWRGFAWFLLRGKYYE